MATYDRAWASGFQFFDNNGSPLNAGLLYIYDTGTTNERTVYKDSAAAASWTQPITLNSAGRLTSGVYVPTGAWKFLLTDSLGTTIATEDAIPGASGDVATTDQIIAQGVHSQYIPATAMVPATTSGPAVAQLEASTNKENYKVLDFDASSDEYAHFQIAFPSSWDEGTVTFRAWWSTTATDTDGIALALQAVAFANGDAIDTAFGTAVVVTDNAESTAGETYRTSESAAITVAGTPAAGEIVFFRLFRDVSDSNDTMAEDLRLIGIELYYTINDSTDA